MEFFGFTITRRPFFGGRVLPWMLLCSMGGALFQVVSETHYFDSFRYGDSIIPKQEQLMKSGPYFMKLHPIRSFYDVEFSPSMGGDSFVVDSTVFPQRIYMREIVENNIDHASAYLWTYTDNPVLKVWRVDVGGQNVLTYDEALSHYKTKFKTVIFMLKISVISFLFLVWSLISIKRTN